MADAARFHTTVDRLEACVAALQCHVEALLVRPGVDAGGLQSENARLLALLRAHPPPRPAMLPQRRLRLAARQQWRCALCDTTLSEAFHVDHRRPWGVSFDDSDENLQVICVPCHLQKTSVEASTRGRMARMRHS